MSVLTETALQRVKTIRPTGAPPFLAGRYWVVPVLVWGTWTVLLLGALGFTWCFGGNVPYRDDWELVPVLTGAEPCTAAWLWGQHNEHRLPLPKLVHLGLGRVTNQNFRVCTLLNVLVLGAAAALLIGTAQRVRGRTHAADAFFPLALLHPGHHECFLMGFLVQFALSTALACTFLVLVVRNPKGLSAPASIAAWFCLLALPYCGVNGLVFVPALGLWLSYAAWRSTSCSRPSRSLVRAGLPLLAAALLVGLFFHDYHRAPGIPGNPGAATSLRTALQFLGMSFGLAGIRLWPRASLGVLGLCTAGVALVALAWSRRPAERVGPMGMMMFLGAFAALALGIGWGRAALGPNAGVAGRYVTLAVPVLCAVYFLWGLYGPRTAGRCVQAGLCLVMALFLSYEVRHGLNAGSAWRQEMEQLESEVRQGLPSRTIAQRHAPSLYPDAGVLADRLDMLRRAGMGPFAGPGPGAPARPFAEHRPEAPTRR